MRLGITAKLFFGVLATSVLVAAVMALTGRAGFQRDFRAYIEAAEARRSEAVVETLAAVYAEDGGWSALAGADRRWRELLRAHPRTAERGEEGGRGQHARGGPRLALYDAAGNLVVGHPAVLPDAERHAVVVDGQTVGWLARARARQPTEAADVRFQQAQARNLAIAGLAAVLFAALAAALLSRTFLAPARELGRATHRLASGDFRARAVVKTADEFGQLADDFNLLAKTLESNEAMRRRMMADVAHELRTPLAVIQGELAALEDGVRVFGPATVASLRSEARSLGKLVDDLYQLSLSDLGALAYRKQDVDLRVVLTEAAMPFRERSVAAGLEFDESGLEGEPLRVHADADRLAQLLGNLLENSLRYTDAPGRIEAACRRDRGSALVLVRDSAPGVPFALQPRLFERFFRVEESRSRASGGAGLGLAICSNIVAAHDGAIEATDSPLGGLQVEVRLPLLKGA